jgi:hypothetical protein
VRLFRDIRPFDAVDEDPPVVFRARMAMSRRDLTRVAAVIAVDSIAKIANTAMDEPQARRNIRINVPAEQHLLVGSERFISWKSAISAVARKAEATGNA